MVVGMCLYVFVCVGGCSGVKKLRETFGEKVQQVERYRQSCLVM